MINQWIEQVINGDGGFKTMENREFAIFKDRDVAIAEFVIRALANVNSEGSGDVVKAIQQRRESSNENT